MDLKLWKDFSSLFPVVLLLLTFVSQTFANEFQMTVTINPPSTTKGSTVVLTCDFTLINERDLHLLYWETTNGERIYTYNHVDNTNSVHTNYQNKVVDYNYEETGGWSRRHTLKLRVNNCDRATYQCLVLNQADFAQGSDQKTLEITSYLPAPTVSMEIDGKSYSSNVYKENTTSITISCTVTNSSVRPDIVLLRGDTDLKAEASVSDPVECLHSGVLQSGDIVVEKDSKDGIFYCQATYGTTPVKSDPFGIVFSNPCDPNPCSNGGTCTVIDATRFECACLTDHQGDTCGYNAGGTEKCSGFLCEEWKIILTCLGALMVLAIIIVVIVVLLKKSNGKMNCSVVSFDKYPPMGGRHVDIRQRDHLNMAEREAGDVRRHEASLTNERGPMFRNGIDRETAKSLFV